MTLGLLIYFFEFTEAVYQFQIPIASIFLKKFMYFNMLWGLVVASGDELF